MREIYEKQAYQASMKLLDTTISVFEKVETSRDMFSLLRQSYNAFSYAMRSGNPELIVRAGPALAPIKAYITAGSRNPDASVTELRDDCLAVLRELRDEISSDYLNEAQTDGKG